MADYYSATLEVREVLPHHEVSFKGATEWRETQLDLDALCTEQGDTPRDALAQALRANEPDQVHIADGETLLEFNESAYGIAGIEDICSALREAGIAHRAWDEGKYEFPGSDQEWTPEDGLRERARLAGGEVALSEFLAKAALLEAGDFDAFGRKVADYFEFDLEALKREAGVA
jgi:hypothetical protein